MYNVSMITSVKNDFIKELKLLKQEKNILCLDNPKLISEAIKEGWQILHIIKTEKYENGFSDNDILVSENVLNIFTNTKTSQGVVAFVQQKKFELTEPKGDFLILDNVQDPGNVGTLIRSAVGANFLDIYLINCASVCLDKTVRSTMGALFKCRVYEVKDDFLDILKGWNKRIFITTMQGKNIYDVPFPKNIGLVIGNEGHGVSEKLQKIATDNISLPMQNNLESLNAGTSGSIMMYQITYGGKNVRS